MTAKFFCRLIGTIVIFCGLANAAEVQIRILDADDFGFKDNTAVSPVGGNTGTTLGEQRLIVLQAAAQVWSDKLHSDVPIVIDAQMQQLDCSSSGAVLAGARTLGARRNFPNAPLADIAYHYALANALRGADNDISNSDISITVNVKLDENDPDCPFSWYYGLDHNQGSQSDLLATLLHEMGHGLGFSSLISETSGNPFFNAPDIYSYHTLDLETGLTWPEMTNVERRVSAVNDPELVWNGPIANQVIQPTLNDAAVVTTIVDGEAKQLFFAPANFGPTPSSEIIADLVLANDGSGLSTEGCNASAIDLTGKVAVIDRGNCDFSLKVLNAQQAGALAVIVVNNVADAPVSMGAGASGNQVLIPSGHVTMAAGQTIKDALPGLTGGFSIVPAGTNGGFLRLFAPDPLSPGSSVSHWSTAISPSLLMEPNITSSLGDDLTSAAAAMQDMGWTLAQTTTEDTYQHIFHWLSNKTGEFLSTIIINNYGDSDAAVTLEARRANGEFQSVAENVPARGFLERSVADLFDEMPSGAGMSVLMKTGNAQLTGRWVTNSLSSASGNSPAQGVAVQFAGPGAKNKANGRLGNALLFGFLARENSHISAPVVVNLGSEPTNVVLYFYDRDGLLVGTDDTALQGLEPYRPFAAPVNALVGGSDNISMVAHSPDQPISGVVFVFNDPFLEPAIGNAQAIDFTPPEL